MKSAVCLRYKEGERAPLVVARGQGFIAERIIEKARESNIPLYTDPNLAGLLMALQPGDEIPKPLYEACAKVIAFILKLKKGSKGH